MPKPKRKFEKIAFVASDMPEAVEAKERLIARYGDADPAEADAIVTLGGDGHMLQTLHRFMNDGIPIYGMNRGSVGFLMNDYSEDDLRARLAAADVSRIHPLSMIAYDRDGKAHKALAINEVSLFRERYQAAKLKILVDDTVRLEELICDGVLVCTPAGSTACNCLGARGRSCPSTRAPRAHPDSPFRPRRWRGALLPDKVRISIHVFEPEKRPVSAVADHHDDARSIAVDVEKARNIELYMMFDADHSLDERVLAEQFRY